MLTYFFIVLFLISGINSIVITATAAIAILTINFIIIS